MINTLETKLGLFFAVVVIAAFALLELIGGSDFFKRRHDLRTQFNTVQDLKIGDPVKMAGVNIGRVREIRLVTNKVEVVLHVDTSALVRTDSKASIQFTGLMGQNYVLIDFGSATAPVAAADTLLGSREQADLGQLMTKLEGVADGVQNMTKSFSGEEFSKLLGPFTDFLKDNNPKLTAILGNMQKISTTIADGKGTVGRLINDEALYDSALGAVTNLNRTATEVQGLLTDAKSAVSDAKAALSEARTTLTGLNKGEGSLGRMLKDPKLYDETTTAMTNLKEILQKINGGQGTVGKLVNDDAFLKNIKMTLQKVDKATEGLEDQGPLSVLGIAVSHLF